MRVGKRLLVRMRSGRRLLVLFCTSIVLPGVLLAVFGVRSLVQERRFATQQLRDRLDFAAGLAARDVDREMSLWQDLLDQFGRGEVVELDKHPDLIRTSLLEPGAAAIVCRRSGRSTMWPAQQMLHELSLPPVAPIAQEGWLSEAESAELRAKDYTRAERLYRQAMVSAKGSTRAEVLHRLARTLRKAGRYTDAQKAYRELASSSGAVVGTLPADLIGRYEICSLLLVQDKTEPLAQCGLELYRDLVAGRWMLERSRFAFYATTARDWASGVAPSDAEIKRLAADEQHKRELLEAAIAIVDADQWRPAITPSYVVFDTPVNASAALLLSRRWLSDHLWPQVFGSALSDGLDLEVVSAGGDLLFRSASPVATAEKAVLARTAEAPRIAWRVRVSPRDPAAFTAELARRQTFYVVMLGLIVALLVSGTYLTTRVVRREVEIARLKSEFVSTVSHEFRSPLTGIRQLGEMLMRGRVASEERRQEYYERITRESDRLSRLV